MSKVLNQKLIGCENNYTGEELYERFGMDDREMQKCMNCRNRQMEGGMITCKYIVDRISNCDNWGE